MTDMEKTAAALEKRRFDVKVCKTAAEAREYLLSAIPAGASVGIGGSVTVEGLGVYDELVSRGHSVYWHWKTEKEAARRAAMTADVYLTSANALTADGRLVNIDGYGNRLAATLYGTGRVIFIVGRNKIAEGLDAAIDRVKNVACPQNARRLGLKTPCAAAGRCLDCAAPDRMCGGLLILEKKMNSHPMEVILVDEDMGY